MRNFSGIGLCAAFALAATAQAQMVVLTNSHTGGFGAWRTNINEIVAAVLTSQTNIASTAANLATASNAFVLADATIATNYAAADTVLSNAFVLADATIATNYAAADTVVSNALAAAIATATPGNYATVSNLALSAAQTADMGTAAFLNEGTNSADLVAFSNLTAWAVDTNDLVYAAELTAASNALASAYVAADTVVSNGVAAAYIAADTVVSNALAGQIAAIDGVTATTATNIAQSVVAASNSLYATATQGSLADSAMQPADGTTLSNGLVAAYIAADTVVSNALAGAGGAATVPVSPYGLTAAWTFDGALTEDWWGTNTLVDSDGLTQAFDSIVGGYVDNTNSTDNALNATFPMTGDFTYAFCARMTDVSGNYVFWHTDGSFYGAYASRDNNQNRWNFTYNDGTSSDALSYDDGETSTAWHHFAFVYNSSDLEVYLYHNGALADESTGATLEPHTWTNALIIGHYAATDTRDVDFGYFYLFHRPLSSNEIDRVYRLESAGQYGVQGLRKP